MPREPATAEPSAEGVLRREARFSRERKTPRIARGVLVFAAEPLIYGVF